MTQRDQEPTATPLFSIVIPVFNDWVPLEECLESLTRQTNAPGFEIIIVDDGSSDPAPDFVHRSSQDHTVTLIRQSHAGVSADRNLGIRVAKGAILLFVDADCKLETSCLAALGTTIARFPQQNCFQLCLVGDRSSLVGRAEELRLVSVQSHTLQPAQSRGHAAAGYSDRAWGTSAVRSRCDCRTLDDIVSDPCDQKGYLVCVPGGNGLRHDRLEGSKNSGDASGAPAIAQVHLENGRAAIHWALGLVRAYGKTGGAARDRRKFSLAAS